MRITKTASATTVFVSIILLPSLFGADTADSGKVVVGRPFVRLMATSRVEETCRTRVPGCTHFVGFRLDVTCASGPDGARASVTAHFTPLITLADMKYLAHEHDHIRDLRKSLEEYVGQLQQTVFAQLSDCESVALRERLGFHHVLRGFAALSTAKRDRFAPKRTNPPTVRTYRSH